MNYQLIQLKTVMHPDPKMGGLTFFEGERDIPFAIKRFYYIYQTEDGESKTLDSEYWETDPGRGVLMLSMLVDTDMGGQLLCRVTASGAQSQSDKTSTARMDVTYYDLETGEVTDLSASGKDTIQAVKPAAYSLTLDEQT